MRAGGAVKRIALAAILVAGMRSMARADAVDDAYEFLNQRHIPFTEAMFLDLVDRADDENIIIFLKAGMSPNLEKHGTPVLIDAARKGRLKVVNALLEGGALPNVLDPTGWTALHYAALFDHLDVAQALVAKGADVHAMTPMGMTALHFAVQERDLEMAEMLLSKGAKPEAPTKAGMSPLAHAVESGQPELLKLFEKRGLGPRIKQLRRQFAAEETRNEKDEQARMKARDLKFKKMLDAAGGSRSPSAGGAH